MKHRHHQPGFTLIEILVTISIIALLAGIAIAVAANMMGSAKRNQTSVMLGQLAGVLTEYQAQTDGQSPAVDGNINTFVKVVMGLGDGNPAERMLRSINIGFWDPGYKYDLNTTAVIRDSWGNELEYFDGDGDNGDISGQPKRQQPYFGSPGPDGAWGSFTNGDPNDPDADAKDNLYSFQIGE